MMNRFAMECVIYSIVVIYCGGKPLGDIPPNNPADSDMTNLIGPKNNASSQTHVLQSLFGLLNKTVVQTLVMDHSNITQGTLSTDKLQQFLSLAKPMHNKQSTSTALENRFQEVSSSSPQPPRVSAQFSVNTPTSSQTPLVSSPSSPPLPGHSSTERPGHLILPGTSVLANPPEYNPQRPFFAGQTSGGRPGQLIPSGESLPAGNVQQILEDRFPELSTEISMTSSKSPLQYNPQRPFFAGETAGGRPGQLIPPGEPLPAGNVQQILEDRFPELSTETSMTSTKSPLQYNPQRPFFAGQTTGGRPGQLIPPGEPLPAGNVQQILEDRFPELSTETSMTSTKSPLQYNPQRPFFAGQTTGGRPGQLIPPGKPLPGGNVQQILEDRFPELSTETSMTSTKSPLQYNPQRPFFAGQTTGGRPGQLIPPGEPLPGGNVQQILEDRFPELSTENSMTSSKSPLQYNPQRPFFAGQTTGGRPGQLIPPGEPLPAGNVQQILEDRFPELSTDTSMTSTKSPLQYNPQKPLFAGQTAGGSPGQLMPLGEPLPTENVQQHPLPNNSPHQNLEDHFHAPIAPTSSQSETNLPTNTNSNPTSSTTTILPLSTSTRSPLEYNDQRPSFASQASSGRPGQLIPPGKPWPADPPTVRNRFPDIPSQSNGYRQRPFFFGRFSNGPPEQSVSQENPWPAESSGRKPLVQDRFLNNTHAVQYRPGSDSLERYFVNGGPDRLVPPKDSWPTNPLEVFDYPYF